MLFLLRTIEKRRQLKLAEENFKRSFKSKVYFFFVHLFVFFLFTVVTQIGGIIYLISLYIARRVKIYKPAVGILSFLPLYIITTAWIVPNLAPVFGREKIEDSSIIQAHSPFYVWTNRNYVTPELQRVLKDVATSFEANNAGIQLIYLDANFPFIDGFPLLPHRYHTDGKKIDVTFVYEEDQQLTNKKPTFSGYGYFEEPLPHEIDQIEDCFQRGYAQYDFTKHIQLGVTHPDLIFSEAGNKEFIEYVLEKEEVNTIFIEPHLKHRLELQNAKIIYHGCGTVRHDDHIHIQVD